MRSTATSDGSDCRVHGKTVVLRGDFHPAGFQILDRLVGAAMAELQLEGLSAKRLAENLVAEANPENRDAACPPASSPRARCNRAPPGRRGRWREKCPAGLCLSASAAVAVAGNTCVAKPCCRSRRRMLYFIP